MLNEMSNMMTEREHRFYPTSYMARADVLQVRPDLAELGEQLTEAEIEAIADVLGERLQEAYWLALEIILDERYPKEAMK